MKNKLKLIMLGSTMLLANSVFACNQYCEAVIAGKLATIASLSASYSGVLSGQAFSGNKAAHTIVTLGNNPFEYCKKGEFINELGDQGWAKISSTTGTWTITNRDVFAGIGNPEDVAKFIAVCPYGGDKGF